MRLLAKLTPRNAFAYDNTVNHKLQGRIYNDLENAGFAHLHDADGPKLFGFTLPFPYNDGDENSEMWFMFTAADANIVDGVAKSLRDNPEFNIGEMPFNVEYVTTLDPRPHEQGTLTTSTPILVKIDGRRARTEFGIDESYDTLFWKPEHGMEVFFQRIEENLQRKYRLAYGEEPPEPPYFSSYSLQETVAKPVSFPHGDHQYILSEWEFGFEVRSAAHRKLLELVLNVGLGDQNSLGFGFMNLEQDGSEKETETETGTGVLS